MLCQYKNILGNVGKGIHSYRLFNIAIMDVIFTILLALVIRLLIPKYKFVCILILLFLLGLILC